MALRSGTYYDATAGERPVFDTLRGPLDARVAVVGGGYAGLNTALGLAERGIDGVVLLEAQGIGHGASGRNGGFAFGGFSRGEADLLRLLGRDRARRLHAGTLRAVARIRERCIAHAIDCDATPSGVLWANWFRDPAVLRARQRVLREGYGVDWTWVPQDALRTQVLSGRYSDALWERDALHLHPLRYADGLARAAAARGVAVHTGSPVVALRREGAGWRLDTPEGTVCAERVVVANGGYLHGILPRADRGLMPIATYVMATAPLGDRLREALRTDAAVYDTRFAFDYYRPLRDTRLLWGGRISIREPDPAAIARLLTRDLLRVFPQLHGVEIEHAWSGWMGYTRNQMPQIGELEPGLWTVQGFGGHGVAPTTFGGELLAAALAEGDPAWRDFDAFGWAPAYKPAGLLAAQLGYWWLQARDAWMDWREGHRRTR